MNGKPKRSSVTCLFLLSVLYLGEAAIAALGQTNFKTIFNFDAAHGASPQSMSLIQGSDGNLYGTTPQGGVYNQGTIFKVSTSGTATTLYSFCAKTNCADGAAPQAGLVQGSDGDLYGTTESGGKYFFGTVFKITTAGVFTSLHSFAGYPSEGELPHAPLLLFNDAYYGTTIYGGSHGDGTVFKITASGTLTTIYSFCALSVCLDGAGPYGGLVQYSGNFYGTTFNGGMYFNGNVFQLTPAGILTPLHSFSSATDGAYPYAGLVLASGNFFGTTQNGGAYTDGTVFQISPQGSLTTLYNFCNGLPQCTNAFDGQFPGAPLIQGADGNLYGTTGAGNSNNTGTIFKITTAGATTLLHSFGKLPGGVAPNSGLVQGSNGIFYGTTSGGGSRLDGTIFSLSVTGNE